jgi:hypothetical protein
VREPLLRRGSRLFPMPIYQLQLRYADGHETTVEHRAFVMLRIGDLIPIAPDQWRIERMLPADGWRFASKLVCRPEI